MRISIPFAVSFKIPNPKAGFTHRKWHARDMKAERHVSPESSRGQTAVASKFSMEILGSHSSTGEDVLQC